MWGRRTWRALGAAWMVAVTFLHPLAFADEPGDVERGEKLYKRNCKVCHGFRGDGKGPAAAFFRIRPRDFRKGIYKYKLLMASQAPTDEDLFEVLTRGLPGTPMPGFAGMTEEDRWSMVRYLRTFSPEKATPVVIPVPSPIPPTPQSIRRGKEVYTTMACWNCHGHDGRGKGPAAKGLKDAWGNRLRPADLTRSWRFKLGHSPTDVYQTIRAGVGGTPMPPFGFLSEEDTWHLVNFLLRDLALDRE